ncbi:1711_t:CDS:2 [Funneliformis geosporum]|uniref:1711_t:CDS:1 n=1 Tax=Funneliformis geosporum TaxID=1117311 RepID=A0A9W4SK04_9GLOM|nr:1711_t:CDS:2 [Funneliformis geosporum]
MVAHFHDIYYAAKATLLLSEADIKEIRESRERLQQGVILFSSGQPVLDENSQTNKLEQIESSIYSQVLF